MAFAFVLGFGAYGFVFRSLAQLGGDGYLVDILAQELLNVLEAGLIVQAYECDGAALGAGTGGTAYAVHVVLRVLWNVIIYDKVDVVNIYSA